MTVELEAPQLFFVKTKPADPETGTDFIQSDDGKGWRLRLMNAAGTVLANIPLRVLTDTGTQVTCKGEGRVLVAGRVATSQITKSNGEPLPPIPVYAWIPNAPPLQNAHWFKPSLDVVVGQYLTTDEITITWNAS